VATDFSATAAHSCYFQQHRNNIERDFDTVIVPIPIPIQTPIQIQTQTTTTTATATTTTVSNKETTEHACDSRLVNNNTLHNNYINIQKKEEELPRWLPMILLLLSPTFFSAAAITSKEIERAHDTVMM